MEAGRNFRDRGSGPPAPSSRYTLIVSLWSFNRLRILGGWNVTWRRRASGASGASDAPGAARVRKSASASAFQPHRSPPRNVSLMKMSAEVWNRQDNDYSLSARNRRNAPDKIFAEIHQFVGVLLIHLWWRIWTMEHILNVISQKKIIPVSVVLCLGYEAKAGQERK